MHRWHLCALAGLLAACGGDGTGPGKPKPDPYLTVTIRHRLDTTTAAGRAHWHIFALLTGPYDAQNGVGFQGAISLHDVRLGRRSGPCVRVASDSVGQRLLSLVAFGDTTTSDLTPDATAASLAVQWYNGTVTAATLPTGWMALVVPPNDAWDSEQYAAGHGLVQSDPIQWIWDWDTATSAPFYEGENDDPALCRWF